MQERRDFPLKMGLQCSKGFVTRLDQSRGRQELHAIEGLIHHAVCICYAGFCERKHPELEHETIEVVVKQRRNWQVTAIATSR